MVRVVKVFYENMNLEILLKVTTINQE